VVSNATTRPRSLYDEALEAVSAGISIVPPLENGTKAPSTNWKFFQANIATAGRIRRWYETKGHTGIGAVMGAISGNSECIEPDGEHAYKLFRDTADAMGLGELLDRIEAGYCDRTPGGGRHLIYRCPEIAGNLKLARDETGKALIETRGEGGYVVCAPSSGAVHASGRAYERLSGSFATIVTITPEERKELHTLARALDQMPDESPLPPIGSTKVEGEADRPGDIYISRTTWHDVLTAHGWTWVSRHGEEDFWRRPGKDRGISATTNYKGSDVLKVFTSSTVFEQNRTYTKFGAYCVLEHGGDFKAATKELARLGYQADRPAPSTFTMGGKDNREYNGTSREAGLDLADFAAYLPDGKYIYKPTGKVWDVSGINRAFPSIGSGKDATKASVLVDQQCPVHDITWMPGEPLIIEGAFLDQGGWVTKQGARVYNSYRPPHPSDGIAAKAERWIDHVQTVYPDAADHIIAWLAHRVQRPGEKLNHALVLGGTQGIGKDTILEPVRSAVGPWNVGDVSPIELTGRFNAFLKSVILRVSELRDLGDRDRYGFYEHTKTLISAPPDTVLIDEKHIRAYRVPNLTGVIFTTNHRTDGLFLPADDRRHFVAWSDLTPDDFPGEYWRDLYHWFDDDGKAVRGDAHVAAYLSAYDLSDFDPKAPPEKTAAFWDIVSASRAPEDGPLADILDRLKQPAAVTVGDLMQATDDLDFRAWLFDRKHARQLPHRMESVGYVAARNPGRQDGLWIVDGKRQVVYSAKSLTINGRIDAAMRRSGSTWA
jgi:hypothetical protein